MSSSFRVPPVPLSDDQIDLFALSQAIWRQKLRIGMVAVGFGLIAAAYAYTATPEYHVSSVLRPAAINELDALNRSDIY
ncbi:chain-length determining protein, partial [Pseudomonas sp. PA-3-10C]